MGGNCPISAIISITIAVAVAVSVQIQIKPIENFEIFATTK